MNSLEIGRLQERAAALYVEGRFSEAKCAWEEILASIPGDPGALEGVTFVRMLGDRMPLDPTGEADLESDEDEGRADPERLLARVGEHLRASRYAGAMAAARRLCEAATENEIGQDLAIRALEKIESAPFIAGELEAARRNLQLSMWESGRQACRGVLALEPGHSEAAALLRLADEGEEWAAGQGLPAGSPVSAGPSAPDLGAPGKSPFENLLAIEDELGEESVGGNGAHAEPTGAGSAWEGLPSGTFSPVDRPGQGVLFELDGGIEPVTLSIPDAEASEEADSAPEAEVPLARHGEVGGRGPEGSQPAKGGQFADIEEEIGESLLPTQTGGDLDLDMRGAPADQQPRAQLSTASNAQPAEQAPPAGADSDSTDLSFGDEIGLSDEGGAGAESSPWNDLAEAVVAEDPGPEERLAALLGESRRALQEGRYSESIEAASRAFAVDPEAPGAQELIDEARKRQDEADRQAEENLYNARKLLDAGDFDKAKPLFQQVLLTHPSHREATEALEEIAKLKAAKEIPLAPAGEPATAPEARGTGARAAQTAASAGEGPSLAPSPVEPLTPRRISEEPATQKPSAPVAAIPAPAPARSAPSRRWGAHLPPIGFLVLMAVCALCGITGLFLMAWAGGSAVPRDPVPAPAPEGPAPERGKVGRARKPHSPEEAPSPALLSVPAAGVARTYQEAKRLAVEGDLEGAQAVLIDVIKQSGDDRQSIDLLRTVHQKIVNRDRAKKVMSEIVDAYKEERYEDALRMLYRVPAEMQNSELELYKANAWFNNGILYLRGGNCSEAIHSFDETLDIQPRDAKAKELRDFARSYARREKDTEYLVFVDSLAKRPIDAK